MEYTKTNFRAEILLIEDDKPLCKILNKHLSKNHDVSCAHDAESAFNQFSTSQFDLIMMDIHIGGDVDGFDIIKQIRSMANYSKVPVIVTTGYAMQHDEREYVVKGFTKLLAKPFSIHDLSKLIEELLSSKEDADIL